MELIKIGIIETAPVPNPFGRVGSACTLSFGAIWKPVDYGGVVAEKALLGGGHVGHRAVEPQQEIGCGA